MLGLFGIKSGVASTDYWYEDNDKFKEAWQKIARRLKWIFGNKEAPEAVVLGYNGFNVNGIDMTVEYFKDCDKLVGTDMAIKVQFDHI